MTAKLPAIAILGTGSMGGAILSGLMQPKVELSTPIVVTNRTIAKASTLGRPGLVSSIALESEQDGNITAAETADIVLIGVKPNAVIDLLVEVAHSIRQGTIVISMAAGISTSTIEQYLADDVAVIRAMPNTPSKVGLGVTGLAIGSRANSEHLAAATAVFETVGDVVVVDETRIDALSAFSGSGPAYVYYLIEQFELAARQHGFSQHEAASMIRATFRGASELLAITGEEPAELRRQVTSQGGTTERAIAIMRAAGLADRFSAAAESAIARAKEMAAG